MNGYDIWIVMSTMKKTPGCDRVAWNSTLDRLVMDSLTDDKTLELKSDRKASTVKRTKEEHSRWKKQQVQRP